MIGFSIMTWFIAVIMIGLSISLLKGNYTFVHGNVFDRTKDKAGYAKKLGKPVLLLGIAISGVLAVALPQEYAMTIVIIFLLLVVAVTIGLFYRVDKYFRKSLLE